MEDETMDDLFADKTDQPKQPVEQQPPEPRPSESKPPEVKSSESKPPEAKSFESKPSEQKQPEPTKNISPKLSPFKKQFPMVDSRSSRGSSSVDSSSIGQGQSDGRKKSTGTLETIPEDAEKDAAAVTSEVSSNTSVLLHEKLLGRVETKSVPSAKNMGVINLTKSAESEEAMLWKLHHQKSLEEMPLFPTTVTNPQMKHKTSMDTTFLITGFGLRNVESLQTALQEEEMKKLRELYKATSMDRITASMAFSDIVVPSLKSLNSTVCSSPSSDVSVSATESSGKIASSDRRRLEYLMGLPQGGLHEEYEGEDKPGLEKVVIEEGMDETITGSTEAMRMAQKYLRTHRIFEFFQFLITQMLSKLPDNPIEFLLELLDKCIFYRGGMGDPPLLYTKRHIEQLFYLMDRMRTGFVDLKQYKTGMITLGICSYNPKPQLSSDGTVAKDVFVTEAYECLTDLLNEMIRKRWIGVSPPSTVVPPPTRLGSGSLLRLLSNRRGGEEG